MTNTLNGKCHDMIQHSVIPLNLIKMDTEIWGSVDKGSTETDICLVSIFYFTPGIVHSSVETLNVFLIFLSAKYHSSSPFNHSYDYGLIIFHFKM